MTMAIPEEEKAVLQNGVDNTAGEIYLASIRLDDIEKRIMDLSTFVKVQQRLTDPSELERELDIMKSLVDTAKENLAEATKHNSKARDVVGYIVKGVIG
jgi:hypothetical protein